MSINAETARLHEQSKLALPQPVGGLLNLALLLLISEAIWHGLFSPAGPVSLYTPNVGLALVITILMVIHWGVDVFEFWPFSRAFITGANPFVRGIILLALYVGVAAVVMFGIYYNVIGRFGPIFFSGPQLASGGGLGQYSQTAFENAAYAQIMMNTCIIFLTILWVRSFGFSPWQGETCRSTRGFSVWLVGMFLAILAFSVLFYPHIAYQFYPPQVFMAAAPWWSDWAMTQSSLFHFGWIVPALVLLYWIKMLWEGRPFSLITSGWIRGLVTMVSVIVAGILIMFVGNSIMNWYFGGEAFMGGMTTEQPAWRWNHVAEMAMFMQMAAAILYYYFDNWPSKLSLPLRALIRTAIAGGGGLIIAKLYYVLGPTFLGTVQGIAQENDTSLCWTVMVLILIVAHGEFFDGFPFKKRALK
jgi:AAT family amino acid transporter